MTRQQPRRIAHFLRAQRWIPLCLVLVCLVGCQSMSGGKSKQKDPFAEDKFSCGELHSSKVR